MITRSHRFHGRGSLRRVYEHGKTVRSPRLGLKFMLNDRRKSFRVAVVVSKTISKSAVVRNRIRRRLYEAVRLQSPSINQPFDLIITTYQPDVETIPADELHGIIKQLFERANIIHQPTKAANKPHAIIEAKEN